MIHPVTTTSDIPLKRPPKAFVAAELALMLAVPVVGWMGFETLLDSRAGEFVSQPGPDDPGWVVFVEPSPVTLAVEVLDGAVTGAALITQPGEARAGGAVVLLPGELAIEGASLSSMRPNDVELALESAFDLEIAALEVVNEARWEQVLGNATWPLENPDPVPGLGDVTLLPVGAVNVGAAEAAPFVGRPADGAAPESLIVRREIWWNALIADPPSTDTTLGRVIDELGRGIAVVQPVPTTSSPSGPEIDDVAMDELLGDIVPFPAGAEPGGRLRLQILGRSPDVDTSALALELGAAGHEIVQIGNASVFDDGPTEILVPLSLDDDRLNELADAVGAASVLSVDELTGADLVTVLVGSE